MKYTVLIGVYPKLFENIKFDVESIFNDVDSEMIIDAKDRAIDRAMELKDNFHIKVVETSDEDFRFYSTTFNSEYLLNENNVVFDTEKEKDIRSILDKIERTESLLEIDSSDVSLKDINKNLLLAFDTEDLNDKKFLDFNKIYFMAKKLEEKGAECTIIEHSSAGSAPLPNSEFLVEHYNPYSDYVLFDENEKSINLDEKEFYVIFNTRDDESYLKLLDKGEDRTFMINTLDLSKNWISLNVVDLLKEPDTTNLNLLIRDKTILKEFVDYQKEDLGYEEFYKRISPTYKSCINKDVFRTIRELEKNNPTLVLKVDNPSYLFKDKEGAFIHGNPVGNKNFQFAFEKLNYDEALDMADRYWLKSAFIKEFGEKEETKTKTSNSTKNR